MRVHGFDLPRPRLTATGRWLLAAAVGGPVLLFGIIADLLLWTAFAVVGRCYGIVCWLAGGPPTP